EQIVVSVAAGDRVGTGAAVDRERDERRQSIEAGDRVVTAVCTDDEVLARADVQVERHRGYAVDPYERCVRYRGERLVAVTAVDLYRIAPVSPLEPRRHDRAVGRVLDQPVVAALPVNREPVEGRVGAGHRDVCGQTAESRIGRGRGSADRYDVRSRRP